MRLWIALLLILPLLACRHRPADPPGASDDQILDRYTAQLEELRSRASLARGCPDTCQVAKDGCELARNVCELTGRHAERKDLAPRCTDAQETCARFNDGCAGCQGR